MDKRYFLQLTDHLRSGVREELVQNAEENFDDIMHQIVFHSCLLIGMRCVAYGNILSDPHREERDNYFNSIESILEILYPGFSKLPLEEKIRVFANRHYPPQTSKEKAEVILRIRDLVSKLKTSWLEIS